MKKVLLSLVLISSFIGINTVKAEEKTLETIKSKASIGTKSAVCVGTNESANSEHEATYACDILNKMGYTQYLYTRPKYTELFVLPSALLASLSLNNVLFFNGHADSNRMHWGEYRQDDYRAGISIVAN